MSPRSIFTEEGENYVVRIYLLERDMQNVSVAVEDRKLKIEAKEQEITTKKEDAKALHRLRLRMRRLPRVT